MLHQNFLSEMKFRIYFLSSIFRRYGLRKLVIQSIRSDSFYSLQKYVIYYLWFMRFSEKYINKIFFVGILFLSAFRCSSVEDAYLRKVQKEFSSQAVKSSGILKESDIAHMPPPVRKYIAYTGILGKEKIQNARIEFDERMYRKAGTEPLVSSSEQFNFYGRPARIFYMKSRMFGIPLRILHSYSEEKAEMQVRAASLFDTVNISGEDLTMAETVTVLNDMCLLVPGALVSEKIKWQNIDSTSAKVFFENGKYRVSAVLYFNDKGELINFISEDRSALQDDGSLKKANWSTPVRDYREFHGIRAPSYGEAVWHYPEGDFVYGKFMLKDIRMNVNEK